MDQRRGEQATECVLEGVLVKLHISMDTPPKCKFWPPTCLLETTKKTKLERERERAREREREGAGKESVGLD